MQKFFLERIAQVDRSVPPGILACLLILGAILCVYIPAALTQSLALDPQRGAVGDTITVTIRLANARNAVEAFAFDVVYDSNVLRYTGVFIQGNTVSHFDFFDVSTPGQGWVRVGGFTTKQRIEPGQSGQLVTLEFKVRRAGQTNLSVTRLVDDMAGWSVQAGHFASTRPASSGRQTADTTPLSDRDRLTPTTPPALQSETQIPQPSKPQSKERPAWTLDRARPSPSVVHEMPSSPTGRGSVPRLRQEAVERPVKSDSPVWRRGEKQSSDINRSEAVETRSQMNVHRSLLQAAPFVAQMGETPHLVDVSLATRAPAPRPVQTQLESRMGSDPSQKTGAFFHPIRIAVPIIAPVLLGAVIIALLSLKGND